MDEEILAKELLDILVCPKCKGDIQLVRFESERHGLKCDACGLLYPVANGIPNMLIDEALDLSDHQQTP